MLLEFLRELKDEFVVSFHVHDVDEYETPVTNESNTPLTCTRAISNGMTASSSLYNSHKAPVLWHEFLICVECMTSSCWLMRNIRSLCVLTLTHSLFMRILFLSSSSYSFMMLLHKEILKFNQRASPTTKPFVD